MKAIEFESTVAANGQISVPPSIAGQVPAGETVRVVLLWGPQRDDDWQAAGRARFEAAYSPEDAVYEALIDETR